MRAMEISALLALAILLSGCAAHPDPIIDTKGVDPEELAQDWDECEEYTDEIVIAQGVGKGAALGGGERGDVHDRELVRANIAADVASGQQARPIVDKVLHDLRSPFAPGGYRLHRRAVRGHMVGVGIGTDQERVQSRRIGIDSCVCPAVR